MTSELAAAAPPVGPDGGGSPRCDGEPVDPPLRHGMDITAPQG